VGLKIGIIGLGDMGRMFALRWSSINYEVHGCDLAENYILLKSEFETQNLFIHKKPADFLSKIDFLLICVETSKIGIVVKEIAELNPKNLIISAQTSVKAPEIKAFDVYLDASNEIVGSHALFGPHVDPAGQTVVMFNHKASQESFEAIQKLYSDLGSKIEILENYEQHDKLMADVQVVTHIGFESLGTAFMHRKTFPWESKTKIAGIDNIKILLTLRIYSYKSHVYAGLAFQNPYAAKDVRTFAATQNDLFTFMISENKQKFESKVKKARDKVFLQNQDEVLLNDALLEEFTLNPGEYHVANSHLSLLSMLCTWDKLDSNPYKNMMCQTPPFRLRVGLVEYLCRNEDLFNETIETAVFDKSIRQDDLAYHTAVHEWANILQLGDEKAYSKHFDETKRFLAPRLQEGLELSSRLISKLY
jgi:prephenate dehydrogenase (NADP+)